MQEREYYFDEGLGTSLNEHIAELKRDFPGVRIQSRRDRDGYAMIKLIFRPSYKYDLAELESLDVEAIVQAQKEA